MRGYDAIVRLPLKIGGKGDGSQPIRDLDSVRGFLSGTGPSAFFDLPWLPVYLAVCFLFHPYIGLTALGGAIILIALTVATEVRTRSPTRHATQFAVARNAPMESSRRNAEAMTAMGMVGRIAKRWREANRSYRGPAGFTKSSTTAFVSLPGGDAERVRLFTRHGTDLPPAIQDCCCGREPACAVMRARRRGHRRQHGRALCFRSDPLSVSRLRRRALRFRSDRTRGRGPSVAADRAPQGRARRSAPRHSRRDRVQ